MSLDKTTSCGVRCVAASGADVRESVDTVCSAASEGNCNSTDAICAPIKIDNHDCMSTEGLGPTAPANAMNDLY